MYLNIHTVLMGGGEIRGQIVNIVGSTELLTDPVLSDNAGNPIRGPRIGHATETFDVALDCSGAGAAGIYAIQVRASTLADPAVIGLGRVWMSGPKLFQCSGAHSQNSVSCIGGGGMVVPNDPTLIGVSYCVQGFCGDPSNPPGRLSTALIQVIEP